MDDVTNDDVFLKLTKQKFLEYFERFVKPYNVIDLFHKYNSNVLTEEDKCRIKAKNQYEGDISAAKYLFERLLSYADWYPCTIQVFRDPQVKLSHVADEMENIKADFSNNFTREEEETDEQGAQRLKLNMNDLHCTCEFKVARLKVKCEEFQKQFTEEKENASMIKKQYNTLVNILGTKKPTKYDSEEESEESSYSLVSRSTIEKKVINVLTAHYGAALVPASPSSQSKEGDVTRARSSSPARPQTSSNMNVVRATEWQYADTMVITEFEELRHLDVFIGQKHTELYGDSANRRYTIFDKIFKKALEKFRKELKSQIAVEAGRAKVQVRYRDLFEQFRNLLTVEMKQEMTDAPLVMSVNAFRGFLDEFRKLEVSRQKDSKKDGSCNQEFNGHRYQQVQFNIVTFCEVCTSIIWIMDRGYVCQKCKFACHKKCHSKQNTPCEGGT
ncbi:unconventional myosin-IXa-like [Physella acuta]|uniref:unconventional myosin-IXa-like n=1 Tax=Physella acuta TaxID=109671 RepID=UPI0027DE9122|nr:unconventional myosin-IXa-like [Physella acuta]